jgi:hypothetical protein
MDTTRKQVVLSLAQGRLEDAMPRHLEALVALEHLRRGGSKEALARAEKREREARHDLCTAAEAVRAVHESLR